MKESCPSVSELLERFFDEEATEEENVLVGNHLLECVNCQETLHSMERFRDLLKAPVEEAVRKEEFPWVWQNIERRIRTPERANWWESFRSLIVLPIRRKKVWVPGLVILAALTFFTRAFILENTPSYPVPPIVEYVESPAHNVMIYELEKGKVTVIWLFDGPETEQSAS
jgi:hypothetical protein